MCGIVGILGAGREAAPVLLDALKRLEYRGYDSAGIATVDVIDSEGLLERAARIGKTIVDRVTQWQSRFAFIEGTRHRGVMIAVQLSVPGGPIVSAALERGLRVNCTQDTVLRMLPAMNISDEELEEGLSRLEQAMARVETQLVSG